MEEIKIDDYSIPKDRFYMKSHEWVKDIGEGMWLMGISDYAQKMLREISYVQFEETGESFDSRDVITVVEALKATGDIYAPFNCELVENNLALDDNPELVSESPYEKGYLIKIKALTDDRSNLISAEEYAKIVEQELEDL
jgi:glycine cleavage system H protein